jgi:hypothetical protein
MNASLIANQQRIAQALANVNLIESGFAHLGERYEAQVWAEYEAALKEQALLVVSQQDPEDMYYAHLEEEAERLGISL